MTSALTTAIRIEARKFTASRVTHTATLLLIAGISVLTGAMVAAADAGNERVLAQLGDLADQEGWARLSGVAAQITAAAGALGVGVVLAWVVGREFAEGTINCLFAVAVPRTTIVLAKLVVVAVWTMVVAVGLIMALAAVGVLVVGAPDDDAATGLARLFVLTVLSGLLATPAAWAATLGRGLLPGIAAMAVMIVVTQVLAVAGAGAWFPIAAPALWAIDPDAVTGVQLGLVAVVPAVFTFLTSRSWSQLQLDR